MHEQIAVGPSRVGVLQQRNETAAIELHTQRNLRAGKFRQRGEQIDVRCKLIDVHARLQHARPAPEGGYACTTLVGRSLGRTHARVVKRNDGMSVVGQKNDQRLLLQVPLLQF